MATATARPLTAAQEQAARGAVYASTPRLVSPRRDFQPAVAVPEPLREAHRDNPAAVLELLALVAGGAAPRESATAACYALCLLGQPAAGVACVEHFDQATYDRFDADWAATPRGHWLGKLRARIALSATL